MNITLLVFQALLLAALIAYAILLFHSRLNPKVIRRSALVIVASGVALYMYAFSLEHYASGILTSFLRSLMLTLRLFVYDADVIDIPKAQYTPYFLDLYYLVFYAAMLTSTSAILMMFGKRAMTWFSLLFRHRKFRHVFVGTNSRSQMIASGIRNEDIAFIEFPDDSTDKEVSFMSTLNGISGNDGDSHWKIRRHSVMLRAKCCLSLDRHEKNVFASIGLEKLKRLTDKDTVFYILSEDKDRNLIDLMSLLEDNDLVHNIIHVSVSREGVARYYKTILKRTGVHFIYPSSMSVVELMKSPSCQPAALMTPVLQSDGTATGAVSGSFSALVIGFGETGQAVTKYLYEFSAAVGTDGSPIPAHIIVNDERVERLKGHFLFDNPDIISDGVLTFENFGTESSQFWNSLLERLDSLDIIAISMKSDAFNLDLACTIFMYAMKKRRKGLDGLKIIVRKKSSLAHEKELVQKMNEKAGHEVIVCYGEYEKIFTPEMIVSKNRSGINSGAIILADRIEKAYQDVTGHKISDDKDNESFHARSRRRMELHQFISRANHVSSIKAVTQGQATLSDAALENLARMEHMRYYRYLAAHGYSFSDEDDDLLKTSHQICSWERLPELDRQYHRDMVRAQLLVM